MDLVRAAAALALPFVTEIWQIYCLIFLLQAASAAFTPTFQATIPDILPDEEDYTKALSLSRLAYDLETLASPMIAAALLVFVTFDTLFVGTALGFAASAALVVSVSLPSPRPVEEQGIWTRTTSGIRIYLATPRLRGLLGLSFSAAACGAMVIVNTVALVRGMLDLSGNAVALALGAFGAGSMLAALTLPRVLRTSPDRPVMLTGAAAMTAALAALGVATGLWGLMWSTLLAAWFLMGLGSSAILTPAGRLLRRSARAEDRPAVFAAQFALSHACWLVAYPLSGWLQVSFGGATAMVSLAGLSLLGVIAAWLCWPVEDHDEAPEAEPRRPRSS